MDENNNPAGCPIGEASWKPVIGFEETMLELKLEPDSLFEKRFRDALQAGLVFSGWLDEAWVKSQGLPYFTCNSI